MDARGVAAPGCRAAKAIVTERRRADTWFAFLRLNVRHKPDVAEKRRPTEVLFPAVGAVVP
jgi:hypothetical protein